MFASVVADHAGLTEYTNTFSTAESIETAHCKFDCVSEVFAQLCDMSGLIMLSYKPDAVLREGIVQISKVSVP